MKVLLCGEGPNDIGRTTEWDKTSRSYRVVDGWMQVLARRLFPRLEGIEFSICARQELVLENRARRRHLPLPSGHGAKALAARLKARRERHDVVVFMLDADTSDVKEWKRKRQEVVDGFARIDDDKNIAL